MTCVNLAQAQGLSGAQRAQAYNCIDTIATGMIAEALRPRMSEAAWRTYAFEMAAQAPAFAMTNRGILIDTLARDDVKRELHLEQRRGLAAINKMEGVAGVWDGSEKVTGLCLKSTRKDGKHTWSDKWVHPEDDPDAAPIPIPERERVCTSCGSARFSHQDFNPGSHPQVAHLLYDIHKLPRQRGKNGEVTTDDRAIDTLGRRYKRIAAITDALKLARGIAKQLGFLKSRLTDDGRFASVFNVGAAWTGRWSSNKNPFGEGGNTQNNAERHRYIFTADPGYELCYLDLKQAESNTVAYLAGDERYIEAHERGDVHTYVCRLVWPEFGWTGDAAADKELAKSILMEWDTAPGHDIRFQAKRLQHGSNYGLTPPGIAAIAHIPQEAARKMQRAYFAAFPGIPEWQRWVGARVHGREVLTNPLGVEVQLFGRPDDPGTFKQGLAYLPQSTVAHLVAIAAWRIYQELDLPNMLQPLAQLQLMAQVHDALLFQFPAGRLDVVKKAIDLMTIPCEVEDYSGTRRTMTIEVEAAVGKNWSKANDNPEKGRLNPDGLREVTL